MVDVDFDLSGEKEKGRKTKTNELKGAPDRADRKCRNLPSHNNKSSSIKKIAHLIYSSYM